MAGKTAIPNELTKVLDIKVEDKSAVLRRFLVELAQKVDKLEERIEKLEASSAP
jgi:polyhydroxyalkanoate synthesis regulator phasin